MSRSRIAGKTSHDADPKACAHGLGGGHRKRPPEIGLIEGNEKLFRDDADDRVRLTSQNNLAADDAGIGSELSAPEGVADDDDALSDVVQMKTRVRAQV